MEILKFHGFRIPEIQKQLTIRIPSDEFMISQVVQELKLV
jgi:hypothetical protein